MDYKSHTGAATGIGESAIVDYYSGKQSIVAKSSTEAEILTALKTSVQKEGTVIYYCKETRGKRRHFINKGTILKKDKRFFHIKTQGGDIIRRTPKYTRTVAIIEE